MVQSQQKYIYIVLSKTDTALGKVIQKTLGVSYNHCSVSLDESLESIYSFGRKEFRNFLRAGFVRESKSEGYFKERSNSQIAVLKVSVTKTQWNSLADNIAAFKIKKNIYKYSFLGLIYCYFGIAEKRRNKYFCSQFVTEVLNMSGVILFDKPETLVRPHDFLEVNLASLIYRGEIGMYNRPQNIRFLGKVQFAATL